MKLTDIFLKYGWQPYELPKPANNLKVYQKDDLLFGVQKIGNVFRIDIQQVLNFGGNLLPVNKMIDNEIVPKEEFESFLNQLLSQAPAPEPVGA